MRVIRPTPASFLARRWNLKCSLSLARALTLSLSPLTRALDPIVNSLLGLRSLFRARFLYPRCNRKPSCGTWRGAPTSLATRPKRRSRCDEPTKRIPRFDSGWKSRNQFEPSCHLAFLLILILLLKSSSYALFDFALTFLVVTASPSLASWRIATG